MNVQQGMMESLGVNTPLLATYGAKYCVTQTIRYFAEPKFQAQDLGDCVMSHLVNYVPASYLFAGEHAGVQLHSGRDDVARSSIVKKV